MGTLHVPTVLEGILEATAAKAQAEARIVTLRAALEDEARRRFDADGAAPSWNAPQLGKVRLEPAGEWTATVADPDEFGSYVAEHHPTEATVAVELKAADAADALQALTFIGVTPLAASTVVRPAWSGPFLKALAVDVDEDLDASAQTVRTVTAADTTTGNIVPGIGVTRSEAKLVVSLDRDRRTAAVEEARSTATALVEAAAGDEADGPDLAALDVRRRQLEALHADQLAHIAKGHGLGSSGSKAALAERIARREQATGHIIRAAYSEVTLDANLRDRLAEELARRDALNAAALESTPGPLPEGTEVEEVTTLPATEPTREPYVGDGADGCRRSAEIDRTEAEGYDRDDPRVAERLASAAAWEAQAAGYPDAEEAAEEAADLAAIVAEVDAAPEVTLVDQPVEEVPDAGMVAHHIDPHIDPAVIRNALAIRDHAAAVEGLGSREILRQHAKRLGVPASGTKRDVAVALVTAGHTAATLTAQEPTP